MTSNLEVPSGDRDDGFPWKALGWGAFTAVRVALFLVLFWMRFVIVPVCHFVSGLLFLIFLFSLYAWPDKTLMLWSFGITSFVAFVVAWVYDSVLVLLSPDDMVRVL